MGHVQQTLGLSSRVLPLFPLFSPAPHSETSSVTDTRPVTLGVLLESTDPHRLQTNLRWSLEKRKRARKTDGGHKENDRLAHLAPDCREVMSLQLLALCGQPKTTCDNKT